MAKYLLILLTSLSFSQQTFVKRFVVDCSEGTVIRSNQDLVVKELVFESDMLPMSYNSKLTIINVIGNGSIVSPSSLTDRLPKSDENEPIVELIGDPGKFINLQILKPVKVTYLNNEIIIKK